MSTGFLDTLIGTLKITAEKGKITEITLLREAAKERELAQGKALKTAREAAQAQAEVHEAAKEREAAQAQAEHFDTREDEDQIQQAKLQLTEYFAGNRRDFQLDIELHGTDFQKKVWRVLLDVPFGETLSYTQVAEKAGSPKAQRAAGNAIGKNPLLIVVPCHRIIRSDGGLGGFSAGIENKIILQKIEGISGNEKRGF